jgi:hypothetical protein
VNHYDTLGVPPDASEAAIKRAYRKKASEAHPDRPGAKGDMVAVNKAWECLGDPERRKRYDEYGDDSQAKPIEQEARDMLLQFFQEAMKEEGDWVRVVRGMLDTNIRGANNVRERAAQKLKRLERKVGKVRVKHGENLVAMLIDQQIAAARMQASVADHAEQVSNVAMSMLEAYEMDVETAPIAKPPNSIRYGPYSTGSTVEWR